MRITLNLATRPYADQGPALKRLRIGMASLAGVLALLAWGLVHFHQTALRMKAQEDDVNRRIAQIEREKQNYQAQMREPANAKVLTQATFLNRLFDEKSFSWTGAMEDLEQVLPPGVQVTAIQPARGKDGRLTLQLRVSGQRERSVEMVRNMEHSRRFVSPRIAGETSESSNAPGELQPVQDAGRVTFEILAEYNPATLEERKALMAARQRQRPSAAPPAVIAPLPRQLPQQRPTYRPPNVPMARGQQRPGMTPGVIPGVSAPGMGPGSGMSAPGMGPGSLNGPVPGLNPNGNRFPPVQQNPNQNPGVPQ